MITYLYNTIINNENILVTLRTADSERYNLQNAEGIILSTNTLLDT